MSKITRVKTKDYTIISNIFLKDRNLSLKAKGVLAVIMGLPEDWDFSIKGLCTISLESETSIRSVIEELRNKGYCRYEEVRESGRICKPNYIFDEKPSFDKELSKRQLLWHKRMQELDEMIPNILDLPYEENTYAVKTHMENVLQLNTKEIKYLMNKIYNLKDNTNVLSKSEISSEEKLKIVEQKFYDSLKPYVKEFGKEMIRDFYDYWTESNNSKTKLRFQMQKTWDLHKRLVRWNNNNFSQRKPSSPTLIKSRVETNIQAAMDALELLRD